MTETTSTTSPLSVDAQNVLDEAVATLSFCDGYFEEPDKQAMGRVFLTEVVGCLEQKLDETLTLNGLMSTIVRLIDVIADTNGEVQRQLTEILGNDTVEMLTELIGEVKEQMSEMLADMPAFLRANGVSEADALMKGNLKFPPALRRLYYQRGLTYRVILTQYPVALLPEVG